MNQTTLALCTSLVAASVFFGCSGSKIPLYAVKGKVVLPDGSPLAGGTVEFRSKNPELKNLNARGKIDENGSFTVGTFTDNDGAAAGEHDVVVIPKPNRNSDSKVQSPPDPIDVKYRDYKKSGLTVKIEPGKSNNVELKVTPPGK